jgi:sulfonate transport system substrate-binding protein
MYQKPESMKTTFILLRLVLITVSLFFVFGCQNNPKITESKKISEVTMGTFSKALGNSPYYIAKSFKWFETDPRLKGIKFNYTEYNDRPSISSALDGGNLQVLFSAEVPQYICRAQGSDLKIVQVSAIALQEIIVLNNSNIVNTKELKGRSIAVLAGTSSHYCLINILSAVNLKPTDLNIKYMEPKEAEIAFQKGKIDAWAVWAPWVEKQQAKNICRVIQGSDCGINSTMAVSGKMIKDYKDITQTIVEIITKAKNWIVNNPDSAQKIASKELGLDFDVVKIAWKKFNWGATLDEGIIQDIQNKANFMTEEKKTRLTVPLDVKKEFVDTVFVSNIK